MLFSTICLGQNRTKYEPPDGRVLHGVGQYMDLIYTDEENWQDVENYQDTIDRIPVIYSVYTPIDPYLRLFDTVDFNNIVSNHNYPYVLVVGLTFHDSTLLTTGSFNVHVQSILDGSMDDQVREIAQSLKAIVGPVYLRPGFEFGTGNAGAHSDPDMSATDFVNIWLHLYNIFQQEGVDNVSWVWNTVNPQSFNYIEWYPGDEYVDWWGINYFTSGQISGGDGFLVDAVAHGKPVMICESSPIENGGTTNASNWENWFVPFFNKIKNQNNIKAFIYINDPWDRGPFASWPDSRITSNATIQDNFTAQMTDSIYIHMNEYEANPGILAGNLNSIDESITVTTHHLALKNYPNPFNAGTVIEWKYSPNYSFNLDIYNIVGQKVDSFIIAGSENGKYAVNWTANNRSSGIYYALLTLIDSGNKTGSASLDPKDRIIKMVLLK